MAIIYDMNFTNSYEEVIAPFDNTTHTFDFDDGSISFRYTSGYEVITNNTDKDIRYSGLNAAYTISANGGQRNAQRSGGSQAVIEVIDSEGNTIHVIVAIFVNWVTPNYVRLLKFF